MRPRQRPLRRRRATALNTRKGLGILFREESRPFEARRIGAGREGKIPVERLDQGVSVASKRMQLIERAHDYV